jgi:excisionase family DNA binding protein
VIAGALAVTLTDEQLETLADRVAELIQWPVPALALWFDVAGAAEYAATTPDAIRCAEKRGHLRGHRAETGRRLRFHRDDLERWIRGEAP